MNHLNTHNRDELFFFWGNKKYYSGVKELRKKTKI